MKRHELKLALTAAAKVACENEFLIIGSQAAHASCSRAPAEVLLSQECDLYPRNRPDTSMLLDRELGRNSRFAKQHGFYVDVVAPEIASLPSGWEGRVKKFRAGRVTAFCLEIHDLLASKLAAGRLKDVEFAGALIRLRLANQRTLRSRIAKLFPASTQTQAFSSLKALRKELG